jgi:hypothetical protein
MFYLFETFFVETFSGCLYFELKLDDSKSSWKEKV